MIGQNCYSLEKMKNCRKHYGKVKYNQYLKYTKAQARKLKQF